jgi:hypothetical protein
MVTAIPLETNMKCLLSDLKQVKQTTTDIFIRSGNDIYRFNRKGMFINQITGDNHNLIRRFTVNPENRQVIVLDSLQQVHYYSFDGNRLFTRDAALELPGQTIFDIAYHDSYLWVVTERLSADNYYEKWLYKMDLSFQPLVGSRLSTVDLGRFYLEERFDTELYVTDRKVYVYSPFCFRETLLQDTLYLIASGQLNHERLFPYRDTGNDFPAYTIPVRLNKRYLFASRQTHANENENYLYCFDRKANKWFSLNGFKDDFFKTGIVKDLQPLDLYNQEYYFYKSGNDISASFPDRDEHANPVLFVVRLNG